MRADKILYSADSYKYSRKFQNCYKNRFWKTKFTDHWFFRLKISFVCKSHSIFTKKVLSNLMKFTVSLLLQLRNFCSFFSTQKSKVQFLLEVCWKFAEFGTKHRSTSMRRMSESGKAANGNQKRRGTSTGRSSSMSVSLSEFEREMFFSSKFQFQHDFCLWYLFGIFLNYNSSFPCHKIEKRNFLV